MHDIDLKQYNIHTDLVSEVINAEKIDEYTNISISKIYLNNEAALRIGKKEGNYTTIFFKDITDYNNCNKVKEVFSKQLNEILNKNNIKDNDKVLIIGLGNEKSTADSLGPKSVKKIIVTRHIYELNQLDNGLRCVSAYSPGVSGESGIESSDIILNLIDTVNPDFIIAIDALSSQSLERLNNTIQITDTGIIPGSGIGNNKIEISKDTLSIPVIAIGVPTVVSASVIVCDTINYIYKSFEFNKKPINKLSFGNINYLKYDVKLDQNSKKDLLGLVGTLNEDELKSLINEVLTPVGYNLVVSSKEIDFLMDKLSDIIGNGINRAIHKNVDNI